TFTGGPTSSRTCVASMRTSCRRALRGRRHRPSSHRSRAIGPRRPLLLQQNVLEELRRARILRLAEPEHRLLADLRTAMVARDLDQFRPAFVSRELAEREPPFLLDLDLRVVVDCARDGRNRLPAGLLRQPEQRLTADLDAAVVARGGDERRQ